MGQEGGRKWTNWDDNDLRLERRQNREGAYLDPNTMLIDMLRYALSTKAYAAATSGWQ